MSTILSNYVNGDFTFTLYSDGTLTRESDRFNPQVSHPSSIDVKITDYCDQGCVYCHESSTTKGIHGDLTKLLEVLSVLPAGVELAIGGGNPLSHPNLIKFLEALKDRGLIANLTVNQGHLKVSQEILTYLIQNQLIYGLGISVTGGNFDYIKPLLGITDNIVYHLIAGINRIEVVSELAKLGTCKILVLGYKQFGFGVDYFSEDVRNGIKSWRLKLPELIGKYSLSFDNLAIEQLGVERLLTREAWDRLYMGDDFTFTMYIDAVKQEYAPTSRSLSRTSFNDSTLLNYFQNK